MNPDENEELGSNLYYNEYCACRATQQMITGDSKSPLSDDTENISWTRTQRTLQ